MIFWYKLWFPYRAKFTLYLSNPNASPFTATQSSYAIRPLDRPLARLKPEQQSVINGLYGFYYFLKLKNNMQLIENASDRKLRGAYYTPPAIAKFILQWGINGSTDSSILEPSCGEGVFLEILAQDEMLYKQITAVEYEASEAEKARAITLHDAVVINADFHRFCLYTNQRFNLVVGNPPFIRYQYYDPAQQKLADEIFKRSNLKRTKLTNAWVTFVVGCSQLLTDTGKMGFVLPSELLMVKY